MILTLEPIDTEPAELVEAEVDRILADLTCQCCGTLEGVELESSRTCYHFEGDPDSDDDPNRGIALCRPCAEEHHFNWDAVWDEYNSGLL